MIPSYMPPPYNDWLIVAATLSAVAALLHVATIFGGAPWYRFFGAGERIASAAEAGRTYPATITFGIATVLGIWATYALSGAGLLSALPMLKWSLVAITTVYLLRGLAILPLFLFAREQATPFMVWSSIICIGYGIVHLVGTMQIWNQL
ncbi:hypothetical protein [Mariprofundus ferrooxydans]|uniref:hypothetical protein n=1 Tax=Mariprofundus ferrooxydans TaxID=314344 RepID=UPI00197E6EF0|nr:hypothetical protein [Mariprofundus ferrooxydans]